MPKQPGALTLSEDDRRVLAVWAADCASRVLPLFEAEAPRDPRPREAIEGARAFASCELRIGVLRTLAALAHAAARDVNAHAAVAAARAAGHAAATAHMAAHARGVPAYAAKAAGDGEVRWAADHASAEVRSALLRLPPPVAGGGELGRTIRLLYELI